ncbi:MAG TPA: hypothetical protein PLZ57_00240 [Pseudobdellovibrionaceae bacterium]|nr:hypothetical protein [Pseudobdellovibrionaceae bacterium]
MNAKRAYPKPASLKRSKPVLDPSSTSAHRAKLRAQEIRDLFNRSQEKTLAIPPQNALPDASPEDDEKTIPLSPVAVKHQARATQGEDTRLIAPVYRDSARQRPEDAVIANAPYSPAIRITDPNSPGPAPFSDATTRIHNQPIAQSSEESASETEEDQQGRPWFAWMLVAVSVIGLSIWQYREFTAQRSEGLPLGRPRGEISVSESRERISFYRTHLGNVLNRQRVEVEMENFRKAPTQSVELTTRDSARPLLGVPLTQEGLPSIDRGQLVPVSPDHPDARIQYSLQEEADREAWTKKANEQYIDDFLANARAQGYDVILDKDLNVIDVRPARKGSTGPSRGGVSR